MLLQECVIVVHEPLIFLHELGLVASLILVHILQSFNKVDCLDMLHPEDGELNN